MLPNAPAIRSLTTLINQKMRVTFDTIRQVVDDLAKQLQMSPTARDEFTRQMINSITTDGATRRELLRDLNVAREPYNNLEVWLVHGTVSPGSSSNHFSDDFINFLGYGLNIPRNSIHLHDWGGRLSGSARNVGGSVMATEINQRHNNSDTNILLIGYSHGGNVVRNAINNLSRYYNFDIGNVALITIATPMRNDYRLDQNIRNDLTLNINIFNTWDSVQLLGTMHINPLATPERSGWIKKDGSGFYTYVVAGRYALGAYNIQVSRYVPRGINNIGGSPAHSSMHSNIELWEHYQFLNQILSVLGW